LAPKNYHVPQIQLLFENDALLFIL